MENTLNEKDIPGSYLAKPFEAATVPELKRWLKCRNAAISGKKSDLVERCKIYEADPSRLNNIVDPDGGVWRKTKDLKLKQTAGHPDKENITSGEWTRTLESLPALFGEGKIYQHLGGKTEKHRIAGYNMYKCKKVENMLVKRSEVNIFELKGIVGASYSKDRYKVSICLDETGTVMKSECSCKAGAKGLCKHVAAILFQLNDYKQSGVKQIEEDLACTEKPRQWGVLCNTRKYFYLTFDGISLGINKKHNHYFQVQAQLGVLQLQWCDFMVYYKVEDLDICCVFITRVEFDRELYENQMLPKLYDFYLKGIVAEIITRRIEKGQKLYPNSKQYIYST